MNPRDGGYSKPRSHTALQPGGKSEALSQKIKNKNGEVEEVVREDLTEKMIV